MRLGESSRTSRWDAWRSRAGSRPGLLLAAVIGISVAGTYFLTTALFRSGIQDLLHESAHALGHEAFGEQASLLRDVIRAPGRIAGAEAAPELVLDVKFKHMRQIYAKREEALALGLLVQGSDDFVPATLRHDGRTTRVSVRLKGDLVDHFEGDKWSFRVHVKDGDHVFGMRRFSLQHPIARGYQAEILFLDTMRQLDVLAPRYRFVDLVVNGNRVGLMALEEHFSKELLEANGRRDSVILKLDESLVWSASDGFAFRGFGGGAFDSYRNARIAAFGEGRVSRTPLLRTHHMAAAGLLRGFLEERLTASEVFDSERLGRFLAGCQLWGAWHAVRWHNLRFAYDPYAARLEPIAFDASLHERPSENPHVVDAEPIVAAMLRDPAVFRAYHRALRKLIEDVASGELPTKWREAETEALRSLHAEFHFLPIFPLARIEERARALAALPESELREPWVDERRLPALAHARLVSSDGREWLEVDNAVPFEIEVRDVGWNDGTLEAALSEPDAARLPLAVAPRRVGSTPSTLVIPVRRPDSSAEAALEIRVGLRGRDASRTVRVLDSAKALTEHPLPSSDAAAEAQRHSFLALDEASRTLGVAPGVHDVDHSIVVPPGFRLRIGPGTTLRFSEQAMLFARGPLELLGTGGQPIVLEARSPALGWRGIAVLDVDETSHLRHVTVRDTLEVERPGWQLTGGTNFVRSDLDAERVRFEGSRAEDALNVVSAHFDLRDVRITNTRSDAFDADFCTGTIEGGAFEDVGLAGGGDAIDLSGSIVVVDGVRLERIGDKGLSVGEASELRARNVVMAQVGTGAVSKDGSTLELEATEIRDARVAALMAYVKKPEYGPGTLIARDMSLLGSGAEPRVQHGSSLSIDSVEVESEALDVDALYATAMKKASAR